jgi:polyhydroxyalkanoate synthesis repressor PhaR
MCFTQIPDNTIDHCIRIVTVIKKYPNRKLYDMDSKQYITLDGIADLIRQEKDIQVIDHATGQDITAVTLMQIILDEERNQQGFFPHTFLTGWIQASGSRINSLQKNLSSSLAFLHDVDKEIRRRITLLIKKGELTEKEARQLLEKLLSPETAAAENETILEDNIERALAERNIPDREDMEKLNRQLEALAAKLDELMKDS